MKSQKFAGVLQMSAATSANSPCCFESVSSDQTDSGGCDLWMLSGHARIEQLLELKEEREWANACAHDQATAPNPGIATLTKALDYRTRLNLRAGWAANMAYDRACGMQEFYVGH
jgi:hypothetical protein